jgi:beta-glucosidase
MVAFNKINGTFNVENKQFLTDLVRTQWQWDGVALSDWGAIHDTAASMDAGMDLEAPRPNQYSPASLTKALEAGTITQQEIDNAVKHVVRLIVRTGLADDPAQPPPTLVDCPQHRALALNVAKEGITLLKNDKNILPLDRTKIKSIAVIGPNAQDTQLGGRWSADTAYFYQTDVVDSVRTAAGSGIDVEFAQGCARLKAAADDDANIAAAAALAAKSDIAIVVVGTDKNYLGEALDVPNLYLPGAQDKLIQAVEAANKNTVVVLNNGMPLLMDKWLQQTPGLVEAWYSGQEQGNAIAAILFGDVCPSGKLAATFGAKREDYSDWPNYPATDGHVNYAEGIYTGYRHFDKKSIEPLFPFGFGLSYTSFRYGRVLAPRKLKAGAIGIVSVRVKNTGNVAGDEVVELYVHDQHPAIDKPIRELKGFRRISLLPGEDKVVTIPVDDSSFSYWDVGHHCWHYDPGDYEIDVGASSRDIRSTANIQVQ